MWWEEEAESVECVEPSDDEVVRSSAYVLRAVRRIVGEPSGAAAAASTITSQTSSLIVLDLGKMNSKQNTKNMSKKNPGEQFCQGGWGSLNNQSKGAFSTSRRKLTPHLCLRRMEDIYIYI